MRRYGSLVKRINCAAVMLVSLCGGGAFAAYHCVRPGGESYGQGTGSDWANAWSGFASVNWSAVRPGDTLLVAGGRYGETLRVRASGSEAGGQVSIVRAASSIAGCTARSGWSSALDNTVIIDRQFICVSTLGQDRITIDGVRDNGIRLVSAQSNDTRVCEVGYGHDGSSHITLRNLEIVGTGRGSPLESTGIYAASSSQRETDHIYHNLTIHGASTSIKLHSVDRVRVTNCRLYDSDCSGAAHENIIWAQGVRDLVYSGNHAYNYIVEGVFARADNSDWLVCNNVFEGLPGSATTVYGFATKGGYPNTGMRIYNNTFYNIRNAVMFKSGATGQVMNNIFHSCVSVTAGDYNWYSGSIANGEPNGVAGGGENPFVNLGEGDFRLRSGASPIDRGRSLSQYFTTDMDGLSRAGGPWDIGAYESGAAGTPPPPPPPPPPVVDEPVDSVSPGGIAIEAESGSIDDPMRIGEDTQASGGRYIVADLDNAGSAVLTFTVADEGYYALQARVLAASTANNSFDLRIDGGPTKTWDITEVGSGWRTVDVGFRESGTPEAPGVPQVIVFLEAGSHSLTVLGREDETRLDRFVLQKTESIPTGAAVSVKAVRGATPKAATRVFMRPSVGAGGSYSVQGRRIAPHGRGGAQGVYVRPPVGRGATGR